LRITNVTEAGNLCAFVRDEWGSRAFRRIETIRFTGGWQLFPKLYNSLCEALGREIATDWGNAMTLAKLGRLYIRNALRNLPLIQHFPFIEDLSFGEVPVLVLGAGPSLDEILRILELRFSESLRYPKDRPFRIICADTCLGALKDRMIIPDLVVILESQHWNLRDFTGCKGWEVKSAVDLSALPQSAKILSAGGFLFMTPWAQLKIFERLKAAKLVPEKGASIIPPLGSVGLTAVELARRITYGKIICAGLDFSFTADKYHARGTPGHRRLLNTQRRFDGIINTAVFDTGSFHAVSKAGASVYSSLVMRNYRDLFEQEFGGDPRLFDIKGSGLPLGLKTLSMEEAVLLLSDGSNFIPQERKGVRERNSELISFFESEKKRLEDLRNILTGETAFDNERLDILIDECDYLWAHFPDYSGGRRPDLKDGREALSFLNRVRVEIDYMIKLL
jgi:hypothetical protein